MRKFFTILLSLFITLTTSANVVNMHYIGSTTTNMEESANNAEIVGLSPDTFYVAAYKGKNTNLPGLNKAGDMRLYSDKTSGEGNYIEVLVEGTTGITLDSVQIFTKPNYGSGLDTALIASKLFLQNVNKGTTQQVRIDSILIYYSLPAIDPTPTGIEDVLESDNQVIYNILGMPVDASYKGIVIKGKRKFLQ